MIEPRAATAPRIPDITAPGTDTPGRAAPYPVPAVWPDLASRPASVGLGPSVQVALRLGVEPGSVRFVRQLLDELLDLLDVDDECRGDLLVAVSEACGNTVRHSRSRGEYQVRIVVSGSDCVVEVSDSGRGFTLSGPPVPAAPAARGGRGLWIMARLVDRLHVEPRVPAGVTVRLTKHLRRQRAPDQDVSGSPIGPV